MSKNYSGLNSIGCYMISTFRGPPPACELCYEEPDIALYIRDDSSFSVSDANRVAKEIKELTDMAMRHFTRLVEAKVKK